MKKLHTCLVFLKSSLLISGSDVFESQNVTTWSAEIPMMK